MQKHTKIYFKAFNVSFDPVSGWHDCVSEISGDPAEDIHHIIGRGRGGEERIENYMSLTTLEHLHFGDKNKYIVVLLDIHEEKLISNNIPYDTDYMDNLRRKYE